MQLLTEEILRDVSVTATTQAVEDSSNLMCFVDQYTSILCGTPAFIVGVIGLGVCALSILINIYCFCKRKRRTNRPMTMIKSKMFRSKMSLNSSSGDTYYLDLTTDRYQKDPLGKPTPKMNMSQEELYYSCVETSVQDKHQKMKTPSIIVQHVPDDPEYDYAYNRGVVQHFPTEKAGGYENMGFDTLERWKFIRANKRPTENHSVNDSCTEYNDVEAEYEDIMEMRSSKLIVRRSTTASNSSGSSYRSAQIDCTTNDEENAYMDVSEIQENEIHANNKIADCGSDEEELYANGYAVKEVAIGRNVPKNCLNLTVQAAQYVIIRTNT